MKEFNITGRCFPSEHYMADVSQKVATIYKMIEKGQYFIINRPRQYGKTTMLYSLSDALNQSGKYLILNTSFEGIGDDVFLTESRFSQVFVELLASLTDMYSTEITTFLKVSAAKTDNLKSLSDVITELANKTDKKIVVMIDEVDKSSNNQLFISFLAMLRNKYLTRDVFKTFHSVVLAGVHDVKSLKLKIRPNEEQKYNSPWNNSF